MERISSTETAKRLAALAKNGPVTREQAMNALGLTQSQWVSGANKALEEGLLKREGIARASFLVRA